MTSAPFADPQSFRMPSHAHRRTRSRAQETGQKDFDPFGAAANLLTQLASAPPPLTDGLAWGFLAARGILRRPLQKPADC